MDRSVALTSLHDELARSGRSPSAAVLDHDVEPADAELAEALGVGRGTEVVVVRRPRIARGDRWPP